MNYIRQLNAFLLHVGNDNRLNCSHVALYISIFHFWNLNRFVSPIQVAREDLMRFSAMGSQNTYIKVLRDLHKFGYIVYEPGSRKFYKSKIYVRILQSLNDQSSGKNYSPKFEPITVPNLTTEKIQDPKIDFYRNQNQSLTRRNIEPDTDAVLSPLIKQNINNINREHNTQKLFNKNEIEKKENVIPPVPNLGLVKSFFKANNYPELEAKKFFYFYEGIGWLAGGKTPIHNWESLAHRWMLNQYDNPKPKSRKSNSYIHLPNNTDYSEPL